MFFRLLNNKYFKNYNLYKKNDYFNHNKIFHFTEVKPNTKRIIFFVKWNKNFTYCNFIKKN